MSHQPFTSLKVTDWYTQHLKTLPPIPKKIYIIWTGSNLWDFEDVPMVKYGVKQLRDMNPDWDFKIYDEDEVNVFIKARLQKSGLFVYSLSSISLRDVTI
jgi:hypothetical protein